MDFLILAKHELAVLNIHSCTVVTYYHSSTWCFHIQALHNTLIDEFEILSTLERCTTVFQGRNILNYVARTHRIDGGVGKSCPSP